MKYVYARMSCLNCRQQISVARFYMHEGTRACVAPSAPKKEKVPSAPKAKPQPKPTPVKRTTGDNPRAVHFISNKELLAEVIACKANGNRISNKLAAAFLKMAKRYSYKSNWKGYSYREDMVAEAVIGLCANWHKFDETKYSNCFAYFTTCMHRLFLKVLNDEKQQGQLKATLAQDVGVMFGWDEDGITARPSAASLPQSRMV